MYIPFSTASRADGLPRPWEFYIQQEYEDVAVVEDIAEEEQLGPPRPQCAVTIDVELEKEEQEPQPHLVVTIYATESVERLAMD